MNYKILLVLLFGVLFIPFISATVVDKPLNISIHNCYNVSIHASLNNGKSTDLQFKDCTKIDNENFNCKCLNKDNNNFSIIMRTDNYPVHELREYNIKITANIFDFKHRTIKTEVIDGGDYYELDNEDWSKISDDYKIVEVPVYINKTIYNTTIEYIPKEVIVYKDRNITIIEEHNNTEYVNVTQYVENETKIQELNKELSKNKTILLCCKIVIGIFLICILSIVITIFITKYNKKTNN